LVNDSALGLPLQESSHDPATTTDDAAPPRSYETGVAVVAEQPAAAASPAILPDRAPGAVDDALAGTKPSKPVASEPAAEVARAEPSVPAALDQASPRDEFAARNIRPQAADVPSPQTSIVVSEPVHEQPAPPAEASLRTSAAPSAREPDASQSVSPRPPTLATPAKSQRRPEADAFMNKGIQLLDLGDVAAARLLFERAADLGLPEAYTAIGETFDPAELGRRRIIGMKGQPDIALKWYRLGDERGDPRARERISRLAGSGW
jgi:TPR repeat protein